MTSYWKRPEVLAAHAVKRKGKYASDPDYRDAERSRQRRLYAEKSGRVSRNRSREALNKICADDAQATYTCAQLSAMLGRSKNYLTRAVAKGLWPRPGGGGQTFTRHEAMRLLAVFADHEDVVSTYRADHTDTTSRLFAALAEETVALD